MRALGRVRIPKSKSAKLAMLLAVFLSLGSGRSAAQDYTCRLQRDSALASPGNKAASEALTRCTREADSAARERLLRRTESEARRLARTFFDIPEYHDEGRLPTDVERPGGELGPFAGIFASPFLAGFTRPAQIYEQGVPGTLAALVVVDTVDGALLPPSYAKLQLRGGLNCVWLYVNPPSTTHPVPPDYTRNLRWTARVNPATAGVCDRRTAKDAVALPVTAVTDNKFSDDQSYLGVARFDTDAEHHPIFSFRCLNAWCEINVANPCDVRTPDALHRGNPCVAQWDQKSPANDKGRREVVKGWHDEQLLAIRGSDYKWKATNVRALVKPYPPAATLDSIDYENEWQTVAIIEVRNLTPDSKYFGWGLREGDNTLQYQFDGAAKQWKAQILPPIGGAVPWKVHRVLHYDVTLPQTTRFRWTLADDAVWAPCGNGCCSSSAVY